MTYFLLIVGMMFFHILDDYVLQGKLAMFKQKSWWEENAPDELYRYDYICALVEHAFSWTCMIHIPVIFYLYIKFNSNMRPDMWKYVVTTFTLNWFIHAVVDDVKANKKLINLSTDQIIHALQILFTALVYIRWCF